MNFSKEDGFNKTYAHYLLFKRDSVPLNKIINVLIDENQRKLFLDMFEIRNKQHVKQGLEVYGTGMDPPKYNEMNEYVSNQTEADAVKQIGKNKDMIDFIHEIVINSKSDSLDVKAQQNNLITSVEKGYHERPYTEFLKNGDTEIKKMKDMDNIDNLAKELESKKEVIIGFISKFKTYSDEKLKNELEAVATLHSYNLESNLVVPVKQPKEELKTGLEAVPTPLDEKLKTELEAIATLHDALVTIGGAKKTKSKNRSHKKRSSRRRK